MKKIVMMAILLGLAGCSHLEQNAGQMAMFQIPEQEAQWIQDGEPIVYEGQQWYPEDRFDVLLDSEVYFKGTYRDVPFFVQKIDVRPYRKIFTKFGRNKFRIFSPRE